MLGVTAVIDANEIVGIITDGDIRRMLNKYENFNDLKAKDIMTPNPKTIQTDALAVKSLEIMQKNGISQLLTVDGTLYKGVVHFHNLIKEGIL